MDDRKKPNRLCLSARDAACFLSISLRTLQSYTKAGRIPFIKIGRRVLYPVEELREWVRRQCEANLAAVPAPVRSNGR